MTYVVMKHGDGKILLMAIRQTLGSARTFMMEAVFDFLNVHEDCDYESTEYTKIKITNSPCIFEIVGVTDDSL